MTNPKDDFPRPSDFPRLADVYGGDGFPVHGPRTPLSDAVLDDALEQLGHNVEYGAEHNGYSHMGIPPGCPACRKDREQAKAQTRAAKEITAAWHDPHWLDGH